MFKFVKIFLAVLLIAGCSKNNDASQKANVIISTANGEIKLTIEEAQTPEEMQKGLMFRDSIPENGGMIFDLKNVQNVAMWMKNTKIPLDMIFVDLDGNINWIYENAVPMSEEYIIPPISPAVVIELNGGDVKKHNIQIGDTVKHKFLNNITNLGDKAPAQEPVVETPAEPAQEPVVETPAEPAQEPAVEVPAESVSETTEVSAE